MGSPTFQPMATNGRVAVGGYMIDTALTLLEPVVILLMGAVVLFIVLATLLPIFSMEQLVS